jgi:hypothetical protein
MGEIIMSNTMTKGLIGKQDINFKESGTSRDSFTRTDDTGRTLTLNKVDGADIQFRTIAKQLDDLVDGGYDVTIKVSKIDGGNLNTNGHTVPNAADDTFTLNGATQTLTGKTLTTPAITNPTITGGGSWAGSPTLTTPTVADLTNMQHNHADAAGGGNTLTTPTIADFTNANHDHSDTSNGGGVVAGLSTQWTSLKITMVNTTTIAIVSPRMTLHNSTFGTKTVTAVFENVNADASGVNGLDTGAIATGWYYIYVLHNPTTNNTTACISLENYPSSPPLIAGYTYWTLVGALYISSTGPTVIRPFVQDGRNIYWLAGVAILTNGVATSFTDVGMVTVAPPTYTECVKIQFDGAATAGGGTEYYIRLSVDGGTTTWLQVDSIVDTTSQTKSMMLDVPYNLGNATYLVEHANCNLTLTATGWRFMG